MPRQILAQSSMLIIVKMTAGTKIRKPLSVNKKLATLLVFQKIAAKII